MLVAVVELEVGWPGDLGMSIRLDGSLFIQTLESRLAGKRNLVAQETIIKIAFAISSS
ncbi:hypothetical protein [Leptolyngbya sp. 7M]|uniref:hypothetical protein n=1 Tax=Leptolyngbya sp. 7M TaxID=2812896 RepID=UPI001B8C6985|nr:hypothetical protein [Leptolyngbya sp. 7M]QYO64891.1 hypothetical protein JVX88_35990 [Leptolyngbya sp. 7M]